MTSEAETSTHNNKKDCYHFRVLGCGMSLRKFPPNMFTLERACPLLNLEHTKNIRFSTQTNFQLHFNEKILLKVLPCM